MNPRNTALFIAGLVTAAALVLIIHRGGLIAWSAALLGTALLVKLWLKPARLDLALSIGLVAVMVVAWVGTRTYVIATWESGEVVTLTIETRTGPREVRLWVLDTGPHPMVYYDAPPAMAEALLAGTPVQFSRNGEASTRIPEATRVDALDEAEAARVLDAMNAKYGDRNDAAVLFYAMLGSPYDRVPLVARLVEP